MARALAVTAVVSLHLLITIVIAPQANARPAFPGIWSGVYSSSSSLQNVSDGTGRACQLCHAETNGGQPWNAYGWAIRNELVGGAAIADAIANVENLDSDGNLGGQSNFVEIDANAQPGWTTGPNNTHFFATGATTISQNPPAAILGEVDPVSAVPGLGLIGGIALVLGCIAGGAAHTRERQVGSNG